MSLKTQIELIEIEDSEEVVELAPGTNELMTLIKLLTQIEMIVKVKL